MGNIVHFSYNYYELEGIPPYSSPFIPIDFQYDWWIDRDNVKRFRFEKRYTARPEPARSGLMILTTSRGADSKILHTEFWDDEPDKAEKDQSNDNLSYADWFENFTAIGRNLAKEIGQENPTFTYQDIHVDEIWGDVHIFQKEDVVQASDIYLGFPLIITYKIGVADFRWIEMEQKIVDKKKEILFRFWRLETWDESKEEELPSDLFDHTY